MSVSTSEFPTMSSHIVRHGVDFSGATTGGSGIRIATRVGDGEVSDLRRVDRLALRRTILDGLEDGARHVWLIDAPFGIPRSTLEACGIEDSWEASVRWLASYGDPREWRRAVRQQSRKEPKRTADYASATPLASMNLRVFKQTWTAMVEVLSPLAAAGVRVEPLAGPRGSSVVVAEGCPASLLKRAGDSAKGYKGREGTHRTRREEILRGASTRLGLRVSPDVARRCLDDDGGDDLDAVLLTIDPLVTVSPSEARVEGWVYS